MSDWQEVQAPFVQPVFHDPDLNRAELLDRVADALRRRGADVTENPLGGPDLLVRNGTGAAPDDRAEILTSGRPSWADEDQPGAIIELLCDGEELHFLEDNEPVAARELFRRLRDAFWDLIEQVRPMHAVVLNEWTPEDLSALETSSDEALFVNDRDEADLMADVAACAGGPDVAFGQGAEGWRCAVVDLPGAEDDDAMELLRHLAETVVPSWISLSGADEILVPGSFEQQQEGFALSHIWLSRGWIGEEALARIDAHLAGAYRAEHAGGVYFSTGRRFNPSGQVPPWDDDEAFDREVEAARVVAEVARRSRGLGPPGGAGTVRA